MLHNSGTPLAIPGWQPSRFELLSAEARSAAKRSAQLVDRHHSMAPLAYGERIPLSSQGCHLPTVNAGVQKLRGQKMIEMKY
jgi:hypothetical protein